jgi:hypothetical protein
VQSSFRAISSLVKPSIFQQTTASRAVAVGDFNGDGFPDLAAADLIYANGTVAVLINNGNWGNSAKSIHHRLAKCLTNVSSVPSALYVASSIKVRMRRRLRPPIRSPESLPGLSRDKLQQTLNLLFSP